MPCFPGVLSNECADQSFSQCLWWMAFQDHLLSKTILLMWWALSPMRCFQLCLMGDLKKWVYLYLYIFSLSQDKWNKEQHDWVIYSDHILVMWCHHQWHHWIPLVKMIEMRHNMTCWSCMPLIWVLVSIMPLPLASCDSNGIINSATAYPRLRW